MPTQHITIGQLLVEALTSGNSTNYPSPVIHSIDYSPSTMIILPDSAWDDDDIPILDDTQEEIKCHVEKLAISTVPLKTKIPFPCLSDSEDSESDSEMSDSEKILPNSKILSF